VGYSTCKKGGGRRRSYYKGRYSLCTSTFPPLLSSLVLSPQPHRPLLNNPQGPSFAALPPWSLQPSHPWVVRGTLISTQPQHRKVVGGTSNARWILRGFKYYCGKQSWACALYAGSSAAVPPWWIRLHCSSAVVNTAALLFSRSVSRQHEKQV